jgi:hypothetical protein
VSLAIGAAILILAWRLRSFALAIGAALALSPIVWLHFFALLIVPIAAVSPQFSALWLVPLLTWFAPGTLNGTPLQSAQVLFATAVALAWCARLERKRAPFFSTPSVPPPPAGLRQRAWRNTVRR